ncbi:hypothetical protein BLOT_014881 [Blomia tropicalis]|nr:hypothetical protein BLOT_014881 [Blomia tropicalis]
MTNMTLRFGVVHKIKPLRIGEQEQQQKIGGNLDKMDRYNRREGRNFAGWFSTVGGRHRRRSVGRLNGCVALPQHSPLMQFSNCLSEN